MDDQRVWKFVLKATDTQQIMMPAGAVILHVHTQPHYDDEQACVWALVDPSAPLVPRTFLTFGTGQAAVRGQYIGTFHYGASLVFHVFEDC